jgi:hypothetical protein
MDEKKLGNWPLFLICGEVNREENEENLLPWKLPHRAMG